MKRITILIGALYTLTAFGQVIQPKTASSGFKRVLIGVNFSPDVCYRTLKINEVNEDSLITQFIFDTRNEIEVPKFGFTTGLNVCFNLSKLIGLETGIQYSNKGYQTRKLVGTYVFPSDSTIYSARIIYSSHYIDVPVKVNFTVGQKKVRFFSSAGLSVNIFFDETSRSNIEYKNGDKEKTEKRSTSEEYALFNLSPMISAGIDYKINSKMSLRFEPTFRYGVIKITDSPITGYLWNGGLNISYYFGI